MTKVYFPADKPAAEWRAMASGGRRDEAASFERCDTDGFLSQWSSGLHGRLYDLCADLAETGGIAELDWIFDAETGEPVADWKWVQGRYGSSILIPGAEYGQGRFFRPSSAAKGATRLARDKAKGFYWGVVKAEVVVMMGGGGTGLAGALSVRPIMERRKGAPLMVVAEVSDRYEGDR